MLSFQLRSKQCGNAFIIYIDKKSCQREFKLCYDQFNSLKRKFQIVLVQLIIAFSFSPKSNKSS